MPTAPQDIPLSRVELHILLSVVDRPRHGYAILQEAEERTQGKPGFEIPTLYRALRRLREGGLIRIAPAPEPDPDERREYLGCDASWPPRAGGGAGADGDCGRGRARADQAGDVRRQEVTSGPTGFAPGAAATLTQVLLLLYPSSFRREMGKALVGDVRRRAADLAGSPLGVRVILWLVRLALSLLINAVAAWVEKLPRPGASWLDVKLALRMLVRQPGLTLVATCALAIGIPVGLLPLHVLDSLSRPLPVEGGEKIVMVRNYDKAASNDVTRPASRFPAMARGVVVVRRRSQCGGRSCSTSSRQTNGQHHYGEARSRRRSSLSSASRRSLAGRSTPRTRPPARRTSSSSVTISGSRGWAGFRTSSGRRCGSAAFHTPWSA